MARLDDAEPARQSDSVDPKPNQKPRRQIEPKTADSSARKAEELLSSLSEEQRPGGDRHNMEAQHTSMKGSNRTAKRLLSISAYRATEPGQKFFVEIFSGSGHLSAAIRSKGVTAYEVDITEKGGNLNVLKADVYHIICEWIRDPNCVGVWFGFPCGTFSAARRNDGGPPPLRGHNPKDIDGLPGLQGKDLARVRSANALLRRMHALMKLAESVNLPFYLENPLRSKLWIHPLVRKWIQHPKTTLVQFDYCQFGENWMKPTQILAFNNAKFNTSISRRCKPTWLDSTSLCSRTGLAHEVLKGKVPGTNQ